MQKKTGLHKRCRALKTQPKVRIIYCDSVFDNKIIEPDYETEKTSAIELTIEKLDEHILVDGTSSYEFLIRKDESIQNLRANIQNILQKSPKYQAEYKHLFIEDQKNHDNITFQTLDVYETKGLFEDIILVNPAGSKLDLKLWSEEQSTLKISIYNVLGELMMTEKTPLNRGENHIVHSIGFLKPGMYIVRLSDENSITFVRKLLKH